MNDGNIIIFSLMRTTRFPYKVSCCQLRPCLGESGDTRDLTEMEKSKFGSKLLEQYMRVLADADVWKSEVPCYSHCMNVEKPTTARGKRSRTDPCNICSSVAPLDTT